MSPALKRKGKPILFPSTKNARGQVVHNLAVQVHELQVMVPVTQENQSIGSCAGSKKYGSIKRVITEAIKVYPWMDRNHVYNCIKAIKKRRQAKQVVSDDVPASRVLQLSNIGTQQQDEDGRNRAGRPKGSTAIARLELEQKTKEAIDLATTQYAVEKTAHGGNLPVRSFLRICNETLEELSLRDQSIQIKHRTILSRLQRKSLVTSSRGVRSPMEKVERVILKFALWKQEAGQPITSGEGIELATPLIKDTPVELEVQQPKAWQRYLVPHHVVLARIYEAACITLVKSKGNLNRCLQIGVDYL
jgi:hypothetical protein